MKTVSKNKSRKEKRYKSEPSEKSTSEKTTVEKVAEQEEMNPSMKLNNEVFENDCNNDQFVLPDHHDDQEAQTSESSENVNLLKNEKKNVFEIGGKKNIVKGSISRDYKIPKKDSISDTTNIPLELITTQKIDLWKLNTECLPK